VDTPCPLAETVGQFGLGFGVDVSDDRRIDGIRSNGTKHFVEERWYFPKRRRPNAAHIDHGKNLAFVQHPPGESLTTSYSGTLAMPARWKLAPEIAVRAPIASNPNREYPPRPFPFLHDGNRGTVRSQTSQRWIRAVKSVLVRRNLATGDQDSCVRLGCDEPGR
jgi:hypothetical protein